MTSAIAASDSALDRAGRRFAKPAEAYGAAPGACERPHHEKPSVTRTRTTLAARKAQRRERMSD